MNVELFEMLPPLMISGIWVGLAVFLTVQAFKYAKLFMWDWLTPPRLALISSGFYSLMWTAVQVDQQGEAWTITIIVGIAFTGLVGALSAALFYGVILKPLLEKLGVDGKYYRNQDMDARIDDLISMNKMDYAKPYKGQAEVMARDENMDASAEPPDPFTDNKGPL